MDDLTFEFKLVAGKNRVADFAFFDPGERRQTGKAGQCTHQPAGGLRHALDEQDAWH